MIKIGTKLLPLGQPWDHEGRTELVQIFISYDDRAIKFLQFNYVENGSLVLSELPDGSCPGKNFRSVTLQYPGEFLTSLKGTYCSDGFGHEKLTSIEFGTNLGRHGPFGQAYKRDKYFDFQMGNLRPFAGFYGFYGTIAPYGLESIGVYVKPLASMSDLYSYQEVKSSQIYQ